MANVYGKKNRNASDLRAYFNDDPNSQGNYYVIVNFNK